MLVPLHPTCACQPILSLPDPCPQAKFFARAVEVTKAHKAACDAKGLKKVADFRNRCVEAALALTSAEVTCGV